MIKLVDENFSEDKHKSENQTAWEAITEILKENDQIIGMKANECTGFMVVMESQDHIVIIGDSTNPHYTVGKLELYKQTVQSKHLSERVMGNGR